MRRGTWCWRIPVLALAAAVPFLGGCGETITVTQYPDFWTPEMMGMPVAVTPFGDPPGRAGAGAVVSNKLASALSANGTYRSYNRGDLRTVLDERDLQLALTGNTEAVRSQSSSFGEARMILVGSVAVYDGSGTQETRYNQQPIYGQDARGNPMIMGYNNIPYAYYRNTGMVECTASLIRLSDGAVVHSTRATGQAAEEGANPKLDPNGCLVAACDDAVAQLVEAFAVVHKEIEISKDALRVASRYYDGKWQEAKEFDASTPTLYVVIALPREADRNTFRLVIVPKGGETIIAEQEIRWDKAYAERGYEFSPGDIAARGGPGEYTVKFYSGEVPVLTRDFRIVGQVPAGYVPTAAVQSGSGAGAMGTPAAGLAPAGRRAEMPGRGARSRDDDDDDDDDDD